MINPEDLLKLIQWLEENGFKHTAESLREIFKRELEGVGK